MQEITFMDPVGAVDPSWRTAWKGCATQAARVAAARFSEPCFWQESDFQWPDAHFSGHTPADFEAMKQSMIGTCIEPPPYNHTELARLGYSSWAAYHKGSWDD